ncbi:MAG: Sua5/YciO/YrdC/YwlC family protein [Bacteriovoracaceae bacterium]|nr:Sua5/YciO/YrdC/YwlC family protein [Bacteriovoracaceae bacterium]
MSDQVYIFPTDTVWGIGAALSSLAARARIEEIKGITRPRPYALIFAQLSNLAAWMAPDAPMAATEWEKVLAAHTTVLFPAVWLKAPAAAAAPGEAFIGVRWQPNDACQAIWQREQEPLISTSLNRHGQAPIIEEEAAYAFARQYAPDAQFMSATLEKSAQASTILAVTLDAPARSARRPARGKVKVLRGPVEESLAHILGSMGLDIDRD